MLGLPKPCHRGEVILGLQNPIQFKVESLTVRLGMGDCLPSLSLGEPLQLIQVIARWIPYSPPLMIEAAYLRSGSLPQNSILLNISYLRCPPRQATPYTESSLLLLA